MKVPPKRKGNPSVVNGSREITTLNESPSEKEGKSSGMCGMRARFDLPQ